MNEEPEQSEWRRRITESMAATTYEQLKALVEGVSGGFREVASSFSALESRLQQIESALNEARLGFGHEAERVRAAFAEHANAVSERVESVSSDLVRDLTSKTQEISAQLAALGEEITARLQELHTEQHEQLTRSRVSLAEAATSITSGVEGTVTELSKEVQARAGETSAAIKESAAATKDDLERLIGTVTSLRDEHAAIAEASTVPLAAAIDDLRRRLMETKDVNAAESSARAASLDELARHLDGAMKAVGRETATAVSESRTAFSDLIAGRLEELSARISELRSGAGADEFVDAVRRALREQSEAAATRWDDLAGRLARRRGQTGVEGDDLVLVALIRSLEQVLDARDRRFVKMLDETARSLPARRRGRFLSRAQASFTPSEKKPPSHRARS